MNIYETITTEIIEAIESGVPDFKLPWHNMSGFPVNMTTGTAYSGVNVILLWVIAIKHSMPSNSWATYKQWKDSGSQVRKGEKGSPIIFYQKLEDTEDGKPSFVAKHYMVFNHSQIEGYTQEPKSNPIPSIPEIESFIHHTGANILRGGDEACYMPALDLIRMPSPELFFDGDTRSAIDNYYSVLFHELTHWTGLPKRLNRSLSDRFKSDGYAMEELIAELGSAFLCAKLNISSKPRLDHAPYIHSWLKVLKSDPKAIFKASSYAKAASEYLINISNH
jgi:antirestriction protein ArdC